MADSGQLVAARNAIARVNAGKAANQDAWMAQWCSTNWVDLLQPAPLSLSLLGAILIIASSTDDFNLDKRVPSGCPPFEWKYASRSESFQTCLQQMVGEGHSVFILRRVPDMEIIRDIAGRMPKVISDIIDLVLQGSAREISKILPDKIKNLHSMNQQCREAAQKSERTFRSISGLAQAGTPAESLAQHKSQLEVLKVQKEHEEATLRDTKATAVLVKNSYAKAEEEFQNAVRDLPFGYLSAPLLIGYAIILEALLPSPLRLVANRAPRSGVPANYKLAERRPFASDSGWSQSGACDITLALALSSPPSPSSAATIRQHQPALFSLSPTCHKSKDTLGSSSKENYDTWRSHGKHPQAAANSTRRERNTKADHIVTLEVEEMKEEQRNRANDALHAERLWAPTPREHPSTAADGFILRLSNTSKTARTGMKMAKSWIQQTPRERTMGASPQEGAAPKRCRRSYTVKIWDLMGMQVVESLASLVASAGNALISQATVASQGAQPGLQAFSGAISGKNLDGSAQPAPPAPTFVAPTTSPNGISSQPNSAALSDPGTILVQRVLDQANGIKMLLTGHATGKPDWDRIRPKDGSTSGAAYVQATLNSQKGQLDTSKPVSRQLATYIEQGISIAAVMQSSGTDDNALNAQVAPTDQLIAGLQGLLTSVNLILQQPGSNATGFATPEPPKGQVASGAAMKVDQMRAQLEASRASFEKASDRRAKQQKEMTKTIDDITKLSLTTANLQQLLPLLKKTVGAFTTLRAQFSQLVQLFDAVESLISDVMGPSVQRWVKSFDSAEQLEREQKKEAHVAGVTLSTFTRDLIFRQIMSTLKVSTLAQSIAHAYLTGSYDSILRSVGDITHMLHFRESDSREDKDRLIDMLRQRQAQLGSITTRASTEIADKIWGDQKKFQTSIDERINTIVRTVQDVFPGVTAPVPAYIKAIIDAHVADTDATRTLQAQANPMFDSL
ncbi:hypothetical protein C8R44DRAFT_725306 [Mycena epipterygia]|nr:hypothetical protein C8R44DRAFT_725306 [Mycena epipterygia]